MTCQRCHEEAAVHLTETVDGRRRELHLCVPCAREAGLALPEAPPKLGLDQVVQGLIVAHVGELVGELAELTCPDCGVRFMEFRTLGRLGCPTDYEVFAKGLAPAPGPVARGDPPRRQGPPAADGRRPTAPGSASAPNSAPRSPSKITSRPRGSATCSAPRTPTDEPGRPDPNFRRVAPRHRPRERHRHVLADPAGAEPQRLPVHQPGQPPGTDRDRVGRPGEPRPQVERRPQLPRRQQPEQARPPVPRRAPAHLPRARQRRRARGASPSPRTRTSRS